MVHVNIRHIAAAKFAVLVLGTAHCLGCLWFLLARWARFSARPNDESWLEQFKAASGIGYGCDGDASAVRSPPARASRELQRPTWFSSLLFLYAQHVPRPQHGRCLPPCAPAHRLWLPSHHAAPALLAQCERPGPKA